MGLNDLQSQINRLNTMQKRGFALIDKLNHGVASAMQNSATAAGWLPPEDIGGGGGGGGGNEVKWARLTSDLEPNDSTTTLGSYHATAILQTTSAVADGITDVAGTIGVFTFWSHDPYIYNETRVSVIKDDNYTAYQATQGSEIDWYRIVDSVKSPVYVRVSHLPTSVIDPAKFKVYSNTTVTSFLDGTDATYGYNISEDGNNYGQYLWIETGAEFSDVLQWDPRTRTGSLPNRKDMYKATFYPYEDIIVIDDIACIMAYCKKFTDDTADYPDAGAVGWMRYSDVLHTDTDDPAQGWWYPMGQRRNIVGQFTGNTDSGDTSSFMLGRWDAATPLGGTVTQGADFEQDSITGKQAPWEDAIASGSGTWPIQFAAGQVYNAMNFQIKGHDDFGDDEADIVACQYDEERGVYLAAPLRCTE